MIKPGRLLDIGCSYGAFMVAAQQQGWETMGVELSEKTARYAREQRGLNVFTGFVEEAHFPDAHFQLISLWDVIEHFEDPIRTLRELT
jgi:2-polyprenyl-3-methyl-5-hydroxy-6-metoxy-1,4-benzoquinol methylase